MSSQTCPIIQPIPRMLRFSPGNSVTFLWFIVEGGTEDSQNPILPTDAIGTFTIYDPTGTPVPGANALPMEPVPGQPGWYSTYINGDVFNPPIGPGYTTVIELQSPTAGGPNTWEKPTVIQTNRGGPGQNGWG